MEKIHEELEEVEEAASSEDRDRIEDEIGDVLFAVANLARHYGIDPERPCGAPMPSSSAASDPSSVRWPPRARPSMKQSLDDDGSALGCGQEDAERARRAVIDCLGVSGKRLRRRGSLPAMTRTRRTEWPSSVVSRSRISAFSCSQARPCPSAGFDARPLADAALRRDAPRWWREAPECPRRSAPR